MARIDCTEVSRQTLANDDWEKRERNKELLHLFSVYRPFKKNKKTCEHYPHHRPGKEKNKPIHLTPFHPPNPFR